MLLTAERIVIEGRPRAAVGIEIDDFGRIARVGDLAGMGRPDRTLGSRVLVPGFVNAHSHAFQRLLRGRTQLRGAGRTPSAAAADDTFWTWRDAMYRVASRLDPGSLFVAARQAFIEMLLAGITTVGEFHYIHHQPDGTPYEDPSVMGEAVTQAALAAGIRLCLLRTVYLRGDFDRPPEALQRRFCDPSIDHVWTRMEELVHRLRGLRDPRVNWGMAAHSIRAVPIDSLMALKTCASHLPLHIHASEQRREVEQCIAIHGVDPIRLLDQNGLLDSGTTLVHATHLRCGDAEAIGRSGAVVCVCPSTEADLGDGLIAAEDLHGRGAQLCLGTDGQTTSSVLAEARLLEMHERLRTERRNVLAAADGSPATTVLDAATIGGARALQIDVGSISEGRWADFVSFELGDPHLAGTDDDSLVAALMFSADSRAVADVIVGGQFVVQDGFHPEAPRSGEDFATIVASMFA